MAKTILKYRIAPDETVWLPADREILHVAMQHGEPTVWLLTAQPDILSKTMINMYGTGWELPNPTGAHIGTIFDGPFVWHFFEVPE